MQWTYASHRSNCFSVALLASSLWISLRCFTARKILRSEEGDVWAPCVTALLCCLTPYPSQAISIDEHTQIKLVQPWPETALAGMKAVLVRAQKQRANPLGLTLYFMLNQQLPILPGRLQPSTFGVYELNYCVRDGNRWILIAIATESVRVCTLKTTQKYIYICLHQKFQTNLFSSSAVDFVSQNLTLRHKRLRAMYASQCSFTLATLLK